jgi:Tfp pilus assembly protein FimT
VDIRITFLILMFWISSFHVLEFAGNMSPKKLRHLHLTELGYRSAMTLVELLIVIAIVVSVTAAVLPTLKESLKDQKVTLALRQIKYCLEYAKSEALVTGKPVAVVFDRLAYGAGSSLSLVPHDTCVSMAISRATPDYSGDVKSAFCEFVSINNVTQNILAFSQNESYSLGVLAKEGAVIYIEGDSVPYVALSNPYQNPDIDPASPGRYRGYWLINVGIPPGFPPKVQSASVNNLKVAYRLKGTGFQRNIGDRVDLPRGICIDLSMSGFGIGQTALSPNSGRQFSTSSIYGSGNLGVGAPVTANYRPVVVVFSPDGSVQNVVFGQRVGANIRSANVVAVNNICFLVGKISGVSEIDNGVNGGLITLAAELKEDPTTTVNLRDDLSYWVSVNPSNGRVSTVSAYVEQPPLTSELIDLRSLLFMSRSRLLNPL